MVNGAKVSTYLQRVGGVSNGITVFAGHSVLDKDTYNIFTSMFSQKCTLLLLFGLKVHCAVLSRTEEISSILQTTIAGLFSQEIKSPQH